MRTKKPSTTMLALAAGPTGHVLATDISATNLRFVAQAPEAQASARRLKMRYLPSALFVAALLLSIGSLSATSVHADPGVTTSGSTSPGNWQMRRLMEPTEAELAREAVGEVVIYDRLADTQVEAAMSAHPERIRSMMFLGTIITDERGEEEVDSYGMYAMEDDGC